MTQIGPTGQAAGQVSGQLPPAGPLAAAGEPVGEYQPSGPATTAYRPETFGARTQIRSEASSAGRPQHPGGVATGGSRRPSARRARLTLTRIDPWSVLKSALVFSSCLLVVWMVAVIVIYGVLSGAGVFNSVNQTLSDVLGTHVSFSGAGIIGGALVLGAFNVVLLSALATVAAFAYNITASLIGGLEVTLAERD